MTANRYLEKVAEQEHRAKDVAYTIGGAATLGIGAAIIGEAMAKKYWPSRLSATRGRMSFSEAAKVVGRPDRKEDMAKLRELRRKKEYYEKRIEGNPGRSISDEENFDRADQAIDSVRGDLHSQRLNSDRKSFEHRYRQEREFKNKITTVSGVAGVAAGGLAGYRLSHGDGK